jgi:pyruvate/2-oxoglutarate dehydrogenase complex dihydrolipoamide dehydrogenase (E3) component
MIAEQFDAVVIGAGSAGYAAARTLASGGAKVAVLEGGREVGAGLHPAPGACRRRRCCMRRNLRQAFRQAEDWGITTGEVKTDLAKLFAKKTPRSADFCRATAGSRWSRANSPFIRQSGRSADARTLALGDGRQLGAKHFVIATGSVIAPPTAPGLAATGFSHQ